MFDGGVSFVALLLELLRQARLSTTVDNRTVEKITILLTADETITILLTADEKTTILLAAYLISFSANRALRFIGLRIEPGGQGEQAIGNLNKLSH